MENADVGNEEEFSLLAQQIHWRETGTTVSCLARHMYEVFVKRGGNSRGKMACITGLARISAV